MALPEPVCPPVILTIAGSDPSGGAGIQADLKAITSLGCYGEAVITALTAQNTRGVTGVSIVEDGFVKAQLDALFEDCPPKIIKTGMLASTSLIIEIAQVLQPHSSAIPLVIDPVTVSTSGHALLPPEAVSTLVKDLIPLGTLLTPNLGEAESLLKFTSVSAGNQKGKKLQEIEEMLVAAKELSKLGCPNILLKGGHLKIQKPQLEAFLQTSSLAEAVEIIYQESCFPIGQTPIVLQPFLPPPTNEYVVDILYQPNAKPLVIIGERVESRSTHGTGCTLSSALASYLGLGLNLREATIDAITYVHTSLVSAFPLGSGNGPLNHLSRIQLRSLPTPTPLASTPFISYLLRESEGIWKDYTGHKFVKELGNGTLGMEKFVGYLKQDYLYLRHYARAHALASFKSTSFTDIIAFSNISQYIATESSMHVAYCEQFGITLPELLTTTEHPTTSAYSRYILDIGQQGDLIDLLVAVASCCLGYGEVGGWLVRESEKIEGGQFGVKVEGNPYAKWISDYSSASYIAAVNATITNLETRIAASPPSEEKLKRLREIWIECTRFEVAFWDMAMSF